MTTAPPPVPLVRAPSAGGASPPAGDPRLACRCCAKGTVEVFHRVIGVPVANSLLLGTADEARSVVTGDLELGCCDRCGFIQNVAFDASLVSYGDGYEDTQAHSARFVDFATELSRRLIDHNGLDGAKITEIGCGKGDFLRLICEIADGTGVGYDPAVGPGALDVATDRVSFRAELYTEAVRDSADLIVCRHTLEHIADVAGFVSMLATSLGDRAPLVFFEVPDTLRILTEGAFWDLYYEHCSYFTGPTLTWLFESNGFLVSDQRLGFDDQYLLLEARPGRAGSQPHAIDEHAAAIGREARAFADRVGDLRNFWRSRILTWQAEGKTMAIWGASSKTVGYLAATGVGDAIDVVVDINPAKHGRYLPGSAHRVIAPSGLPRVAPDVVIAMNPIYVPEITDDVRSRGLGAEVVAL